MKGPGDEWTEAERVDAMDMLEFVNVPQDVFARKGWPLQQAVRPSGGDCLSGSSIIIVRLWPESYPSLEHAALALMEALKDLGCEVGAHFYSCSYGTIKLGIVEREVVGYPVMLAALGWVKEGGE